MLAYPSIGFGLVAVSVATILIVAVPALLAVTTPALDTDATLDGDTV